MGQSNSIESSQDGKEASRKDVGKDAPIDKTGLWRGRNCFRHLYSEIFHRDRSKKGKLTSSSDHVTRIDRGEILSIGSNGISFLNAEHIARR